MMHQRSTLDVRIQLQILEYIVTLNGMGLYHGIFIVGQACGLAEDGLGDLQLADIMEQTGHGKRIHIPVGHAQPVAEDMADQSHVHAVGEGGIIVHAHIVEHVEDLQSRRSLLQKLVRILQKLCRIDGGPGRYGQQLVHFSLEIIYGALELCLENLVLLGGLDTLTVGHLLLRDVRLG